MTEPTKATGNKPLTLGEFQRVTKLLLKNKSPGIDGIPAEFFQAFKFALAWLFEIIALLTTQKKLTEAMTTAIVKLLFKKGECHRIGNYHPLSFSCADYKYSPKSSQNGSNRY